MMWSRLLFGLNDTNCMAINITFLTSLKLHVYMYNL